MSSDPRRPPYPSDVSERQWRLVASLLPQPKHRGRRRSTDMREVVNALRYRWTTGCGWRMLPHDLPPWPTIYTYFRQWHRDGTLRVVRDILLSGRLQRAQNESRAERDTVV